jgi:hypothetical protein
MELADLKKMELRPVEADFHGLNVVVNVNAITGRHCRTAAERIRALGKTTPKPTRRKRKGGGAQQTALEAFDGRGRETEELCTLYAVLLKGTPDEPLLMSWDLTDEGEDVPCTQQELQKRHPGLLKDLYEFCVSVDRPKSQETRTTPPSRTISGTSGDTSPVQETPQAVAPSM